MPRGPRGEKRPADVIGAAVKVMRIATGEETEEDRLRLNSAAEAAGRARRLFRRKRGQRLRERPPPRVGKRRIDSLERSGDPPSKVEWGGDLWGFGRHCPLAARPRMRTTELAERHFGLCLATAQMQAHLHRKPQRAERRPPVWTSVVGRPARFIPISKR